MLGKPAPVAKKPKMNKKAKAAAAAAAALEKSVQQSDDESDENDDQLPAQEPALIPQRKTTAFQQRDLVKRAFANDNVVSVCLRLLTSLLEIKCFGRTSKRQSGEKSKLMRLKMSTRPFQAGEAGVERA